MAPLLALGGRASALALEVYDPQTNPMRVGVPACAPAIDLQGWLPPPTT